MKEIFDFPGYSVTQDGRVWSEKTKRFLSPVDNGRGYQKVVLMRDGKRVTKYVHRLVPEAFIPNPENKPCVDHIDCNKQNNSVSNLRWVTHAENNQYAWDNGLNERAREVARETTRERFSKPVRCQETGQEFRSATEATQFLGTGDCTVSSSIRQGSRCGGYHWEYV